MSKRQGIGAVLKKPVNRSALKKILETFSVGTLGSPLVEGASE